MTTVEVALNLPDQLAQWAQRAGLMVAGRPNRMLVVGYAVQLESTQLRPL